MDDTNTVYDEADLAKSEEFKDKGNEYFKGKHQHNVCDILNIYSQPIWKVYWYVYWSYLLQDSPHKEIGLLL